MDESSIKPEKRSRVRGRDHLILYELMPSGRAVSAGKAAHPVTTFVLLFVSRNLSNTSPSFSFSPFSTTRLRNKDHHQQVFLNK